MRPDRPTSARSKSPNCPSDSDDLRAANRTARIFAVKASPTAPASPSSMSPRGVGAACLIVCATLLATSSLTSRADSSGMTAIIVHLPVPSRSLGGLARIWTDVGATQQYYPPLHSAFGSSTRFGATIRSAIISSRSWRTPSRRSSSRVVLRRLLGAAATRGRGATLPRSRMARRAPVRSASRPCRVGRLDIGAEEHARSCSTWLRRCSTCATHDERRPGHISPRSRSLPSRCAKTVTVTLPPRAPRGAGGNGAGSAGAATSFRSFHGLRSGRQPGCSAAGSNGTYGGARGPSLTYRPWSGCWWPAAQPGST